MLTEQNIKMENRQSSKGNQLKWYFDDLWYKADYTGYEGLAEYMISRLLTHSDLPADTFVDYDTEKINYHNRIYTGCRSKNFLPEGWRLITLERLFQIHYQKSLYKTLFSMDSKENRLRFLVNYVVRMTGLEDFGIYMSKLMTIDAFFLNEDRHTHNIAVLLDPENRFHYCPVFDNGAGLMSDTAMDYPLTVPTQDLFGTVSAKTFSLDFDEQLDIAEELYGQHLKFHFTKEMVSSVLAEEINYPPDVKERVFAIIMEQKRKYRYLFS